ncbi:unnamed protein product [Brassica oleracea var. botrytis]|uniref:Uncharacterized protein n=2 Tax=Brassica TaxID=3705 RepID=A0A8S9PSK8_BRACR|nr:hypothetical protein F2Q69_00048174 [Brassica cretica]CAF2057352.1 unnamed protein product [Brassica napus]
MVNFFTVELCCPPTSSNYGELLVAASFLVEESPPWRITRPKSDHLHGRLEWLCLVLSVRK